MQSLNDQTVVVAGATGNVGPFVVRALLERGASVAAPSRSEQKLGGLREHLREHVDETSLRRLHTFAGDLGDEHGAAALRQHITEQVGTPDAVVASVGDYVAAPSLLDARAGELQRALDASLVAHFVIARTFLPVLRDSGGTYVFLQGPLAFELYPGLGGDLVSIATAAQHMLFRALAQEVAESRASVVELVGHMLIRDRQAQPTSPLSGEAVGAFVAHLVAGAGEEAHGHSIQLRSREQLADLGIDTDRVDAIAAYARMPAGAAADSIPSKEPT
jgi:NAD(P)-dependent dehydrogenase (short-subunit alcohol dehydrogenase family)